MTAAVLTPTRAVIAPPAPDSPDTDLIRLCSEYAALAIERDRILLVPADVSFVAVVCRLAELAPVIAAMPARTDEGVQAKAAAALHQAAGDSASLLKLDAAFQRAALCADQTLIAICDRLLSNMDALDADPNDIEPGDARWEEILRQRETIRAIVPTSLAGHQRRAAVYLRTHGGVGADGKPTSQLDGQDMFPILRDLAAAVPPASPDAQLIALCARHDALLAEANRIGNADTLPDNADAKIQRLTDEAGAIGQTIATMRATTPAGIVALARTTAAAADGMLVDNDTDPLLQMLFRDSLALGTAQPVPVIGSSPATGASPEITAAVAAVVAARAACDRIDATTPGDEDACNATADVHGRALDACGSVRITTLADASAIAALALRYLAADDIAGQADVVTRGLLQSLAAIPATGIDMHPDAELLVLHDRFIALEAKVRALIRTIPDDRERDAAREPLAAEQGDILAEARELRATTLAGHRARARMLAAWDTEIENEGQADGYMNEQMVWLLVRDLLGEDHADALQSSDLNTYLPAVEAGRSGAVPTPSVEPVFALIAEANRLRAEAEAFPWDSDTNHAEFSDLCSRTSAAIHAVAAAPTTSRAGLRAVAQFLIEEQLSGKTGEGFNHSDAESAALVLLKRLAADPEPSNVDAGIIALCDQVVAAWEEYWRLSGEQDALPGTEETAVESEVMTSTYDRACALYDAIQAGPLPQTPEGLRAVARAAVIQASDSRPQGPFTVEMPNPGAELAWKLVGHLAGLEVQTASEAA